MAAYPPLGAEGKGLHTVITPSPAVDADGPSPTSADSTVYLQNDTSTWETGSGRTSVLSGELLAEGALTSKVPHTAACVLWAREHSIARAFLSASSPAQ